MGWIQTYMGRVFDLNNPTPDMVDPIDVAHALSNLCRFSGHTVDHYSVAQHSVIVSYHVPEYLALAGLLHDAAEAYVGDVAKPLKDMLVNYDAIEDRVRCAVAERFGVPFGYMETMPVKVADVRALVTERRDLLGGDPPAGWGLPDVEPFGRRIEPWSARQAKVEFLARLEELAS